ncbi:MAG TPA: hypothetical protein VHE13_17620 [Opitutus sp.]|nr:hypothetical protein [Opitutus sp.]
MLAAVGLLLANLVAPTPARATTVLPPTFDELVNNSDYIVRARTKAVTAEKQQSAHGAKIYTEVELEIVDVVGGTPPAQVTLRFLGGRVGDEQMIIEGMPRFHVGDEDILFVSGNGRSIAPLYGMMHGRFPVRTDRESGRKYVTRANGAPLGSTAQIAAAMTKEAGVDARQLEAAVGAALGPTDFIRLIRAAIKPDARLNRAP